MSQLAVTAMLAMSVALGACTVGNTDRQWYKASGDYTSAEFDRDRRSCTQNRQLDEDCLRERGWTSLSGDIDPVKPVAPTPSRTRSY